MSRKTLNTMGLVAFTLLGLVGILFRIQHWPMANLMIGVGFFGFPILYGYISWPVGRRIPDGKWFLMIAIMLLFALMILFKESPMVSAP